MNFRFTIARKLTIGFGVLLIAVLWTSTKTYTTLENNLDTNRKITNIYTPSTTKLNDLFFIITNSKMLIKNWVFIEKHPNTPDKIKLMEIHAIEYPEVLKELRILERKWEQSQRNRFENLVASIDSLFDEHQTIMGQLSTFESYENLIVTLPAELKVEENGDVIILTDRILENLSELIQEQTDIAESANAKMENSFASFQQLIIIMAFILVIAIISIAIITGRALVGPINYIKDIILSMGHGILPSEPIKGGNDEIGEMSKALNILVSGLRRISEFALEIGKGNFISEFKPLSDQDMLGNSLVLMRENLKQASKDEAERKRLDSQRSWSTQGIAKFGDILRENNDQLEELSARIVSELVKYLEANQGGLFIINHDEEGDKYLELIAFYAYNRSKYKEKRIEIGETLVGQCVKEKETIYMTDIPDNYMHISSGLGEDKPRSLIIVPLQIDEEVYGAVEIASFSNIEPYQIDFVEKVGENIASTIARVKINIRTSRLLSESQEKSERLALQEEEMRMNIDRLKHEHEERRVRDLEQIKRLKAENETKLAQLTNKFEKQQKELTQQKVKIQNNLNAINNSVGTAEFNMDGRFVFANSKYLRMAEMTFEDLRDQHHSKFMLENEINTLQYQSLWPDLNTGKIITGERHYIFGETDKWFYETFTPVKDDEGKYFKVIKLAYDITAVKMKELEWQRKLQEAQMEIERLKK